MLPIRTTAGSFLHLSLPINFVTQSIDLWSRNSVFRKDGKKNLNKKV